MRGEKRNATAPSILPEGSPPHARGKAQKRLRQEPEWRITPACAGKRPGWLSRRHIPWDHPRMRGEKCDPVVCHQIGVGSPPHARGKVCSYRPERTPHRITPACAGKSLRRRARHAAGGDHPRMRGEKLSRQWLRVRPSGSPPHARGKD